MTQLVFSANICSDLDRNNNCTGTLVHFVVNCLHAPVIMFSSVSCFEHTHADTKLSSVVQLLNTHQDNLGLYC